MIRTYRRYGKALPAEFGARPKLSQALTFVLDAFWEIGTDRHLGMAEGPIPFGAIDRFAKRAGLTDRDAFSRFRSLIRSLDREYLAQRAAQQAASRDPQSVERQPTRRGTR